MTKFKKFPLRVVISITTGRKLCEMDEIYAILNHMTNDNLYTHQLPRAAGECEPWLRRAYPWLNQIDARSKSITRENWESWLAAIEMEYADRLELDVPVIPRDDHEQIDPIIEAKKLAGLQGLRGLTTFQERDQ